MPNRYVREAAIESERVNQLSWQAEVFWRRLINRVDDFGRIEASPALLRAKIFPLQIDKVAPSDVEKLIKECVNAGLVITYNGGEDSKHYLQMLKWEQGRALKSKYPEPPADANICKHMKTDENNGGDMSLMRARTQDDSDTDSDTDSSFVAPSKRIAWSEAEGWLGILNKDKESLKDTYPAVSVDQELKEMHTWLLANPAKAKKKNYYRFIVNWLSRRQEKGGSIKSVRPATPGSINRDHKKEPDFNWREWLAAHVKRKGYGEKAEKMAHQEPWHEQPDYFQKAVWEAHNKK